MSAIVTSDIHLSERPQDEYRWPIFRWLEDRATEIGATEVIILGDVTDAKDKHSSKLVNRLCKALVSLSNKFSVVWLAGNHDFLTETNQAFFRFLGMIEGISFISKPARHPLSIGDSLFVPAGEDWKALAIPDVKYIFAHATFSGAKAENGQMLTGVDPEVVAGFGGKVFSGDIHSPQKLRSGKIEYIGSPTHIKFGDRFRPRVLVINDNGTTSDLYYPAPKKHVLDIDRPEELKREKIAADDQVKVRCYLRRADYVKWRDIRQEIHAIAQEKGWQLFGPELMPLPVREEKKESVEQTVLSPKQLLKGYADKQRASDNHLEVGNALLEAVQQ